MFKPFCYQFVFIEFKPILCSFRIPGSALIAVLEHSVSQYDASHPDPGGRFLQLSGLIVTFDVRRAIGQRVVEAKVASTGEKVVELFTVPLGTA